jgi:hypothetical protein
MTSARKATTCGSSARFTSTTRPASLLFPPLFDFDLLEPAQPPDPEASGSTPTLCRTAPPQSVPNSVLLATPVADPSARLHFSPTSPGAPLFSISSSSLGFNHPREGGSIAHPLGVGLRPSARAIEARLRWNPIQPAFDTPTLSCSRARGRAATEGRMGDPEPLSTLCPSNTRSMAVARLQCKTARKSGGAPRHVLAQPIGVRRSTSTSGRSAESSWMSFTTAP